MFLREENLSFIDKYIIYIMRYVPQPVTALKFATSLHFIADFVHIS
jgi:hypothetical protein